MKRKLFCLLTLLLTVCSGAWADTEVTLSPLNNAANCYFGVDGTAVTSIENSGDASPSWNSGTPKIALKGTQTATLTFTLGTGVTITSFKANGSLHAKVSASLDGSTVTMGTTLSGLSKTGTMSFVLTCNDAGGNSNRNSTISSFVITYTTSSGGDTTPPTLSSSVPANGDTGVATSGTIVLTFNEAIASVDASKFSLTGATKGVVAVDGSDATKVNVPYSGASYEASVTLSVAAEAVEDASGNKSAALSDISFTTKAESVNYNVTYSLPTGAAGILPANAVVESGTEITLPDKNYTLYMDGYTMTGWEAKEGDADPVSVAFGANYTVTGNVTIKPVFAENTVSLSSRNTAVTVKWGPFTQKLGVPVININGTTGFVVAQATVNGETIDVQLPIDASASGAKFINQETNNWTQVNPGIKFTIPATDGATVSYKQYDNGSETTPEATATGNTYELTLTGTSGSLYVEYIQVVLPTPALSAESDRTWDFTNSSEFTDAASSDKTYSVETLVNNLYIGKGAQLMKSDQRLKLNKKGTASPNEQYYVKIKVAEHSQVSINAVGGDNRNLHIAENNIGGTTLFDQACGSSRADYVLSDSGEGDKVLCIYNAGSNDGNITLYSITVAEYVAAAPTSVTITPSPAAAYKDASITLTAVADGAPTPTITWYQCDDAEKTNPVSKGTGTTYNPSTSAEGTFYFYATATNSEGSATSSVVTLNVTDPNKYGFGNAYYFTNGETAINNEYFYGDNITVKLEGANGGINDAVSEGSVATLDANYVAVVTGKDGGNGWGPSFTPSVNGTVTFGAFFNGNGSRKLTITNVESFTYQNNGDAEATLNDDNEYTPASAFRGIVTFEAVAGTNYRVSFSGSKMGFYGFNFTPSVIPATISASGWTSLASAYDLDFSGAEQQESVSVVAYAISSIKKTSVTLTPHDAAPAGVGMILKGNPGSTYSIPVTTSVESFDNELSAAVNATAVEANSVYAVSGGKLKLFTGTEVPAGKAYLLASKVPAEAHGLTLDFDEDGETTGIAEISSKKGLLDGDFYDLSGRKVAQPTKGLYIMNGKKVIIK